MKYAARDRKTHKFIPEFSRHALDLSDFRHAALFDTVPEVRRRILTYYMMQTKFNRKHETKLDTTFDVMKVPGP